jgi:hypothetical protein
MSVQTASRFLTDPNLEGQIIMPRFPFLVIAFARVSHYNKLLLLIFSECILLCIISNWKPSQQNNQ